MQAYLPLFDGSGEVKLQYRVVDKHVALHRASHQPQKTRQGLMIHTCTCTCTCICLAISASLSSMNASATLQGQRCAPPTCDEVKRL